MADDDNPFVDDRAKQDTLFGGEGGGSAPRFTDVFAAGTATTAATASSGSDIDVPDVEERGALSPESRGLIDLAQTRRFETDSSAAGTVSVTPTPSGEADYRVERPVFNEVEDGRGGTRPERVGTDVWTMDQSQFSRAVERGQYTLANNNVRGVQADSGARRRFDGLPDPDDAGLTLPGQNADAGSDDSGGRGMEFDAEPPVQLLDADSASADNRDAPTFTGPTSRRAVPGSGRDEVFETTSSPPTPLAPEDFTIGRPSDKPGISDDPGSIGTTREEDPDRNVIAGALSAAQGGRSSTQTGGINFGATPAVPLLDAGSADGGSPGLGGASQADTGLRDTDLIRAESNGRFNREPVRPAENAPGLRAGNGRLIGDDYVDSPDPGQPIARDADTGQFEVRDR